MMPLPFGFPRPYYPYRKNYPLHKVPAFSALSAPKFNFPKDNPSRPFSSVNLDNQKKRKSNDCKKDSSKACSFVEEQENDPPLFHLFGINLYYDDILILMLLFFLYKEDVKDPSLFLSLILLLLS